MISIVICHRNLALLDHIKQNISNTIGVPYEIVIINNTTNKYSIFQAYNLGVKQSKFDLICFVHEDIAFHTNHWGNNILEHFKDEKTGMVGVAGGTAFPSCPAAWWNSGPLNELYFNIIQHRDPVDNSCDGKTHDEGAIKSTVNHDYYNPLNEKRIKVTTLDGVFLCARKEIFNFCRFDDKVFKGFHCYDSDICFQIFPYFNIYVIFDVLIEHFSPGTPNRSWTESTEILINKWGKKLPLFAKDVPQKSIPGYNIKSLLNYCKLLSSIGYSDDEITQVVSKYHTFIPVQWSVREYFKLSAYSVLGKRQTDYIIKAGKKVLGIKRSHSPE